MSAMQRKCMTHCPPWGYCQTPVTAEQFVDGVCGSPNGIHGYDGYVTQKEIDQRMRDCGLGELVERREEFERQSQAIEAQGGAG